MQETKAPTVNIKGLKDITQVVYILQLLSIVFFVTPIIAVIINYLKRDEVKNTWLESHFKWQIRTFWYGLLWLVIGTILVVVLVGALVLIADMVWIIYRAVRGWLLLLEDKPIKAYDRKLIKKTQ